MLGGASVLGAAGVSQPEPVGAVRRAAADELKRRLADADAAVIMKLGRNFPKVRQVLAELGLDGRALYVERRPWPTRKSCRWTRSTRCRRRTSR
jgi:precorrin-2/cobalt-factor-2 C20-methyltransferase